MNYKLNRVKFWMKSSYKYYLGQFKANLMIIAFSLILILRSTGMLLLHLALVPFSIIMNITLMAITPNYDLMIIESEVSDES